MFVRSVCLASCVYLVVCAPPGLCDEAATPVTVTVDVTHPLRSLAPLQALGSTVDKEPAGSIPRLYSKKNVSEMLDAGLGFLSYRLFTELSDQDWHWNPRGAFSAGDEGYWISSASTAAPAITDSFGYRLTHRGNTTDQGNNEDYSRLDDGDVRTYWKSDPYLTHAFTGDPDSAHPQWALVDLGARRPVNAVRIVWANPFATRYRVQYWRGDDAINDPGNGSWQTFPNGDIERGRGGDVTLHLADRDVLLRFVRIVMTASSNTCDTHGSKDRRNCVGYAIDELYVGVEHADQRFHDHIRHVPCGLRLVAGPCKHQQSITYVSSVDPWHSAGSRVTNQEQPGLDLVERSGLTRGLGAIFPVAMLYSTPQNAVAEVAYLEKRGYPLLGVELGEEPDGQYVEPEDDAALFVQFARAIHRLDPALRLGGPVFSGVNSDIQWWPDAHGDISWLHRFLGYLRSHDGMRDLGFFSFEHYPFDGCEHGDKLREDLLAEPGLVRSIVQTWHTDGLPPAVPMYITEANFSAVNFTQTPMQIEGALWQADYMASALFNGVDGAVYYQYEPVPLSQNTGCPSDWGNLTMFDADARANIRARTAQFYGVRMLTSWLHSADAPQATLYPAATDLTFKNMPLVTAYAANVDGRWSIMLVNKDSQAHALALEPAFTVNAISTFSPSNYAWRQEGHDSHPDPDTGPTFHIYLGGIDVLPDLPADSITVLTGTFNTAEPR